MQVITYTTAGSIRSLNPARHGTMRCGALRRACPSIAAEADGEVLMMHVESGNYFGLNEVASFIWQQLETPSTIAELCDAVLAELDVEQERCQADALEFLQGTIDDGLAEVVVSAELSTEPSAAQIP